MGYKGDSFVVGASRCAVLRRWCLIEVGDGVSGDDGEDRWSTSCAGEAYEVGAAHHHKIYEEMVLG